MFEIPEARGFEVFLVNPWNAKKVPGRKTGINAARWLRKLHQWIAKSQLSAASEHRIPRAHLRQSERMAEFAASHIQHMQKALMQGTSISTNVVADISGATGIRIIRAIISGERNAAKLALHRDPQRKQSAETIRNALLGN